MLLVKLIEPPCTERYARWCERSGNLVKFPSYSIYGIYPVEGIGVFRVPKNGDARNTKPTCYAGGVNLLIAKNHLFVTIELFRHYRRKEKVI